MKTKATLAAASIKQKKADYNGNNGGTVLSLSLDIVIPSPTIAKGSKDWFSRKDYAYRKKLKDAEDARKAAAGNGAKAKGKKAATTNEVYSWSPDAETAKVIQADYQHYLEQHAKQNLAMLRKAQEASLFMVLLGQEVEVDVTPAQRAFAGMLAEIPALSAGDDETIEGELVTTGCPKHPLEEVDEDGCMACEAETASASRGAIDEVVDLLVEATQQFGRAGRGIGKAQRFG